MNDKKLVTEDKFQSFFKICKAWELTDREADALLRVDHITITDDLLSSDTDKRLTLLIGVHDLLSKIFSNTEQANAWPKKQNKAFDSRTALHVMLEDENGLTEVYSYLSAQRN